MKRRRGQQRMGSPPVTDSVTHGADSPTREWKGKGPGEGPGHRSRQGPRPLVSSGCILLPVVIAVWWYWTKRRARSVVAGVLEPDIPLESVSGSLDEAGTELSLGRGGPDGSDLEYSTWYE